MERPTLDETLKNDAAAGAVFIFGCPARRDGAAGGRPARRGAGRRSGARSKSTMGAPCGRAAKRTARPCRLDQRMAKGANEIPTRVSRVPQAKPVSVADPPPSRRLAPGPCRGREVGDDYIISWGTS